MYQERMQKRYNYVLVLQMLLQFHLHVPNMGVISVQLVVNVVLACNLTYVYLGKLKLKLECFFRLCSIYADKQS